MITGRFVQDKRDKNNRIQVKDTFHALQMVIDKRKLHTTQSAVQIHNASQLRRVLGGDAADTAKNNWLF